MITSGQEHSIQYYQMERSQMLGVNTALKISIETNTKGIMRKKDYK
jgi:hypothetical protein